MSTQQLRVVALVAHADDESRDSERILVDEPLSVDTLPLLQAMSAVSQAVLDGAGMEFRPRGIAVYVNGKRLWTQKSRRTRGSTADCCERSDKNRSVSAVPFTDAYGEEWSSIGQSGVFPCDDATYGDESDEPGVPDRLADNRAAWDLLRNDYSGRDEAEEIADDLLVSSSWLRPSLPTKTAPTESTENHAPYPCPMEFPKKWREEDKSETRKAMTLARARAQERVNWVKCSVAWADRNARTIA